jgi:hypothetical protein
VAQASRQFDLVPSKIEDWMEQARSGMENALRVKPEDVRAVRTPALPKGP